MTSDNIDNLTDEELMERFMRQVKHDMETITDPEELAALSAVVRWAFDGD